MTPEDDVGVEPPVFDVQEPQGQEPQRATSAQADALFERADATIRRRAENDFLTNLGIASETDPSRFAEAREIAKTLNVSPDAALENFDVLRAVWKKRQAEIEQIAQKAPALARAFQDLEFARLAHDDVENLGFFEGLVESWKAGHAEVNLARIGRERMRYAEDPPEMLAQARIYRRYLRHAPQAGGFFWGLSRFGGQSEAMASEAVRVGLYASAISGLAASAAGPAAPVTVPVATVGGFTSGFTASFLTQMYTFEAGSSFDQLIQMGYDRNAAREASNAAGLINMSLEATGLGLQVARPVIAPLKALLTRSVAEGLLHRTTGQAARTAAKSFLLGAAGETSTEVLQELTSTIAEDWAKKRTANPDADPSSIEKGETWQRLVDTGVAAAQLSVMLGAVPEYVHYRHLVDRAGQAQATRQFLENAIDTSGKSKLVQRAPDAATQFFGDKLRESGAETVYVDGRIFAETLKQLDAEGAAEGKSERTHIDQLARDLPDVAEQLAAAAESGTDVEIKTSDFIKLGDTDLGKKLLDHARLDPNDPSFAAVQEAGDLIKDLEKTIDDRAAFNDAADAFEKALLDQTKTEVGRVGADVTDTQVRAAAALARRMYERLADEQGKTVAELKPLQFGPAIEPSMHQADEQKVNAAYDVANNRITLTKETKVHTLMHEITHSVWNMAVAIPERSPGFQKDITEMFNWMGVTEEQWKAMTPAEREPHQEKVARAGELYFATGKAPTVELQGMFDRIAKWFRDIYRDIVGRINAAYRQQFGTDLPALTPEVRQFFDHLLAAEDTIANAEAIRGRVAAFEERASFPGTDEEWSEYQAMVQARREGGVASLSAEVQKNLAWLQRSRDRVSKEVAAEARKLREAAGEEARGDVENQNVYRLRTWLKTGKKAGEKVHKLSIADVKSILGVEAQDYLKALEDHVTEDGWSVDAVAEDFGYDTGEQMLRELLDAPTKADAIENRIDEIMLRDHGTLRNAEEQAMAIEEALNNENASRLAYATLRFAQKIKSPDRLTKAAVHEAARLRLEAMPVRKIRAHSFSVSAAKLERQAAEAFKGKKASKTKGGVEKAAKAPDPEEGIRLLQQSLLNTEMARQALKIERAVAKEAEKAKRFFQSDKKLRGKFNLDWVNVGRAILSGFSFGGNRSKLPLEYMASLAEYDPLLHARLDTYVRAVTGGNTLQDYRDLPLQEFRDLTDSLDMLWTRAQRERQVEVEGKLVDKEEAKKQIAEILAPRISTDGPTTPVPLNGMDQKDGWFRTQLGHLAKVEHTLRYLDGGKANGPMQRYFWTTLRKALDRYHLERGGYLTTLNKELDALHRDGLLGTTQIDLRQFLGEEAVFQNTAHLLGALIHMGNQSNLQNLLLGYEWGTMDGPDGQKVLNTARWDAALQHLADKGTIKKQHIDFLQKIGKVNEGLKEAAQRVNKEVYGAYFEEVEIKPIKTPWGTYDGWYAPSPIDHDNPANTLAFLEKNGDNPAVTTVRDMVRNSPGVPHNWTIARVGGVKPRLLDLTKSAMHFDEMLRFIHLQIPLRDVWSLATDPEVNAMLEAVAPGFVQNTLQPMLDDTGLGSMNKASMAGPMLGRVMSLLTRNTSRAFMAFSIRNYLQQFTGVAAIVPYTGLAHAWGGVRAVFALGGPGAAREFIESKSDFFKARQQEHQGTQLEEMRTLLDPTWKGKLDKVVDKVAFGMIGASQRGADYVAWIAGYNKWLADHPNDEAGAITAGDSTVRLSQGSRTTMDTARIERGSPEMKLFTQFTHYWLNMAQQIAKTDQRAAAIFWAAIVPTMAGAAIAAALSGGKEFEDKDEEFAVNKLGWWLVNNPIRGGASMVPVVGPVVGQILTGQGGSLSMFPAQSVLEAAFRTARNLGDNLRYIAGSDDMEARVARSPTGATSGRGLRDLGLAISGLTGVPVKKVFEALGYLEDRADRRTERNWVSGLLGEGR